MALPGLHSILLQENYVNRMVRASLCSLKHGLFCFIPDTAYSYIPDIAYMDFQKAFDSVPHQRLISKLSSYGISGDLLTWLEAFLSHRRQRIAVNNATSVWAPVTSGIPQGTVLGPILFVIFVNDLPNNLTSETLMFADDTKLLKVIKSDRDSLDFQSDLDRLHHWSSTWQLKFNPNKCKIMHARRQREEHLYTMITDENDTRTILEETTCEKDLGLHVDNQLLFDLQTKYKKSLSHIPNLLLVK